MADEIKVRSNYMEKSAKPHEISHIRFDDRSNQISLYLVDSEIIDLTRSGCGMRYVMRSDIMRYVTRSDIMRYVMRSDIKCNEI